MHAQTRCKILVVEGDGGVCRSLNALLCSQGYEVICIDTGKKALEIIASHCPDCILLDPQLPDMDGAEVVRSVRAWSKTPILAVCACDEEAYKAQILDLGADDYLTRPFGEVELMARIRAALRHTWTTAADAGICLDGCFHVGELCIDYRKRRAYLCGRDANLTPNEFRIVALLGRRAGEVVPYREIMRELWGPRCGADNKILRVHMASIRCKIEPHSESPLYIFTQVGVGYRMAEGDARL